MKPGCSVTSDRVPVSQICQDVSNKNEFAQATNSESEALSWRRKRTSDRVYSTNVHRDAAFPISILISFNRKKEEDKQDEEIVPILRFDLVTLIARLSENCHANFRKSSYQWGDLLISMY